MSSVLLEIKNHIGIVTINKPNVLNALSTEVLTDLDKVVTELEKNNDLYAVIITGAGEKSFVAGADIAEMKDKNPKESAEYAKFAHGIFTRIENLHCPVIAAVNGFALGGGCELALACDIRIASNKARFAQPEVGLGITPGFGGTQRLPRIIGTARAKELIYTCRHVKADEALSIGLVTAITEPEKLMEEAMKLAELICAQAPIAVKNAKTAINKGIQVPIEESLGIETEYFSACFATEDQKMAMTAFVNKEKNEGFKNK
ncbi:enoyl-CoA hydratase [Treponema phagedenis]|uniref:3-hydroxybutyryl-CoA dehydratase n=1 Tax=Treponema phagedenis TaxID=162 RepID=A0A0B7GTK2_TREPH|nr:enoyl-CoA hydratase-related protein [Treponema phagedenis]EFW36524.1 3-hydroxybutyryl-CoA dehydratase [Treponema phagedenis F0421]NVP24808.1 enoyl-CoA hydratase/isomerase family protein [Treponema phagedenis]QEJ95917.1 enoyl-CoA hydratase [Treponema phagedenis]QEJ98921.1 enoyl-CoA hydratase [Treponema phagedenis]QEK00386.1 enoyl-CoA hydratase [Treponema phagedenis]